MDPSVLKSNVKWKLKEGKAQWNISRYIVHGGRSRSATW